MVVLVAHAVSRDGTVAKHAQEAHATYVPDDEETQRGSTPRHCVYVSTPRLEKQQTEYLCRETLSEQTDSKIRHGRFIYFRRPQTSPTVAYPLLPPRLEPSPTKTRRAPCFVRMLGQ